MASEGLSCSFSQVPKGVCVHQNAEYQVSPGWQWGGGRVALPSLPTGGEGSSRARQVLTACLCPQPGSPVYSSKCQDCMCTRAVNSSTQLNVINCTHVPCNVSCDPVSPADPSPLPKKHTGPTVPQTVSHPLVFSLPTPSRLPILAPTWPAASPGRQLQQPQVPLGCRTSLQLGPGIVCVHRALNLWRPLASAARSVSRPTAS